MGAENEHVPRMLGWESAERLSDAIDMARARQGRSAQVAMFHIRPIALTQNLG